MSKLQPINVSQRIWNGCILDNIYVREYMSVYFMYISVVDKLYISCSCHWHFLKYPVCTFHTILHWHIYPECISYTCLLKYTLSAFNSCHWNVFLFRCMSRNGWFNKLTKTTFIWHPPPPTTKTWPVENYEKRRNKQLSSRKNTEMYTSKYMKDAWQTRFTYTCIYS